MGMKKKNWKLLAILFILFGLWMPAFGQEETKIPVTNVKTLEGTWMNVGNVIVNGQEYPNAMKVNGDPLEYVLSKQYRFFVAEVGCTDDSQWFGKCGAGFFIESNNKKIAEYYFKLGDAPRRLRLRIDDCIRLKFVSGPDIVWFNPYFIK
jgi:hypothetical protein